MNKRVLAILCVAVLPTGITGLGLVPLLPVYAARLGARFPYRR